MLFRSEAFGPRGWPGRSGNPQTADVNASSGSNRFIWQNGTPLLRAMGIIAYRPLGSGHMLTFGIQSLPPAHQERDSVRRSSLPGSYDRVPRSGTRHTLACLAFRPSQTPTTSDRNCLRGQLRIARPRGLDFGPPGYYGPLCGIASSPLPAPVVRVRRG